MKPRTTLFFALIGLCILLTACGQLEIKVEPIVTSPSPFPTPIQVIQTPFSIATPSQFVPTPMPVPVVTSTVNDLHLKPGLAVKLLRTKMMSETNGWAIGTVEGDPTQHILFSSDGGLNWKDCTPLQALTGAPAGGLAAVAYFASDNSAWVSFSELAAVGTNPAPLVVWHTDDNGASWQESTPLDLNGVQVEFQTPSDLGFLDEQQGWIMVHVGAGMMHDYFAAFITADGGQTWQRILDPSTKFPIMSCEKSGFTFTSAATGWISGNCPGLMPQLFIFHTIDSGANWASATLPAPDGKPAGYFAQSSIACGIPALDYSAGRTLLLTLACQNLNNNTAQAWLYASSDDGTTWKQHPLPLPYNNLSMLGPDEGFLVGSLTTDPAANGAVYHSADSGATWSLLTSTAWTGLPDFVDDHTGWVIATHNDQTAYVHTLDGGRTWIEIKPVTGE